MSHWPIYGRIEGAIVMIGFGSIGKGTLPLIERHFEFDKDHFVVIDPNDSDRKLLDERGIKFVHLGLTKDNYREVLGKYLTAGKGQGFCVNLSVDTSSLDIMRYCREIGALYVDTVVEPWPGSISTSRSATSRAPTTRCARPCSPSGATIPAARPRSPAAAPIRAWCPGSSSRRSSTSPPTSARQSPEPKSREEWGKLAQRLGRQGRAHRRARHAARQVPQAAQRVRQHLVGRRLPLRGHAAGRTRLGHAREMGAGQRRLPRSRLRRGDLHQPARRQHPRPLLDADRARPVRLPRHPQRGDLDRRLLHRARRQGRGGLPPDLPLRLSPLRRRGAVAARTVRPRRQDAEPPSTS